MSTRPPVTCPGCRSGTAPDSWGVWFAKDPTAGRLEAVPRRGRQRRLCLDRTRPAGFPAAGPAAAARRAGLSAA